MAWQMHSEIQRRGKKVRYHDSLSHEDHSASYPVLCDSLPVRLHRTLERGAARDRATRWKYQQHLRYGGTNWSGAGCQRFRRRRSEAVSRPHAAAIAGTVSYPNAGTFSGYEQRVLPDGHPIYGLVDKCQSGGRLLRVPRQPGCCCEISPIHKMKVTMPNKAAAGSCAVTSSLNIGHLGRAVLTSVVGRLDRRGENTLDSMIRLIHFVERRPLKVSIAPWLGSLPTIGLMFVLGQQGFHFDPSALVMCVFSLVLSSVALINLIRAERHGYCRRAPREKRFWAIPEAVCCQGRRCELNPVIEGSCER